MDLEILGRVGAGVSKLLCRDGDGAPRLTVTSATSISVRNISDTVFIQAQDADVVLHIEN